MAGQFFIELAVGLGAFLTFAAAFVVPIWLHERRKR